MSPTAYVLGEQRAAMSEAHAPRRGTTHGLVLQDGAFAAERDRAAGNLRKCVGRRVRAIEAAIRGRDHARIAREEGRNAAAERYGNHSVPCRRVEKAGALVSLDLEVAKPSGLVEGHEREGATAHEIVSTTAEG